MKTAGSSTTFHKRIKEYKTKSLKCLLQEVHVLHPARFKNYIYETSVVHLHVVLKSKKQHCFAILKTALERQWICNTCLHEKLVAIHKLSTGYIMCHISMNGLKFSCIPFKTRFYVFKKFLPVERSSL